SAEEMVPDVVPIRVLASAIAALCALAMVVVLAPALRPPAPHAIIGDRRIDFVATRRPHDGADRLLVTPGTERTGRKDENGGASREREEGAAGALAGAAATVQDWLQQALGAEEHWESGEPVPSNPSEKGARSPQREHHPTTMAATDDRGATGAGQGTDAQAPAAERAGGAGSQQEGGGPGAGAGPDALGRARGGAGGRAGPGPRPLRAGNRRPRAHAARGGHGLVDRCAARRQRSPPGPRRPASGGRAGPSHADPARLRPARPPPLHTHAAGRGRSAMTAEIAAASIRDFQEVFGAVRREIARVVVGHDDVVDAILRA